MSGSSNATISMPGAGWEALWPYSFQDFQLDIVGFLAILGEGSVTANAQVAALSTIFFLPRLIPAPQALLWPTRRVALEPTVKAFVTAVESGNVKDHIHHVASVLLSRAEDMPVYTVRCVEIKKIDNAKIRSRATLIDRLFRGQPPNAEKEVHTQAKEKSLENGNAQMKPEHVLDSPSVKPKAFGPLAKVTVLDFLMSVALLVLSFCFGDGMSILATVLLSLLSTLVGISNKWTLQLARRRTENVPAGDLVIRYIKGSFLIVKCDENVARELFFAPEEINYLIRKPWQYRLIALVGTLLLMLGVIALANARLELQFAWAAAYIIINALHWVVAAVPPHRHWDFECYELQEQGIENAPDPKDDPTFTDALWRAIQVTKTTAWCRLGHPAAPMTEVWDEWLLQADKQAHKRVKKNGTLHDPLWPAEHAVVWGMEKEWDAKTAWNDIHNKHKEDKLAKAKAKRAQTA